jgi:predicted  nucleic acid-binding Zn ribbon protein
MYLEEVCGILYILVCVYYVLGQDVNRTKKRSCHSCIKQQLSSELIQDYSHVVIEACFSGPK